MTLGPILPGRLPNSFATQRLNEQIQATRVSLQKLQDQLTTGQRYQVTSEDPASALKTIIFQSRLERQQQFQTNLQTDRSLLGATEDAFTAVDEAISRSKGFILQGLGDTISDSEREGLATEVDALVTQVLNAGNTRFRGRFLFGGSRSDTEPFQLLGGGQVRYSGDTQALLSYVDTNTLIANNLDGNTAFGALNTVDGTDLDPALTLQTRLSDLHRGAGLQTGSISVTVLDGTTLNGGVIDLSRAQTIDDIRLLIENAFASTSTPVTVDIDPATNSGLRITPASGTITVSDVAGSRVAGDLGIATSATAQVLGSDLDPSLNLKTRLADLNDGSGIGATAGTGLQIVIGNQTHVIDLDGLETIEELFNELALTSSDLAFGFNPAGNGLSISSRISGAPFSIGENGGTNAESLGIRTLTGSTRLSELNLGLGSQFQDGHTLNITRRDGSTVSVDVSSALTIQDVISTVNAVDPGNLVLDHASIGNGLVLVDNSGTGPLSVEDNSVGRGLGLAGTETGTDATVALAGSDIGQRESQGLISVLSSLAAALRAGDDRELTRLDGVLSRESDRFLQVRGELGTRMQTLEQVQNRLLDEEVKINDDLSQEFDADLSEVLTAFLNRQQTLQATFQVASQTFNLSLISFL